jgi:hypothetical protein
MPSLISVPFFLSCLGFYQKQITCVMIEARHFIHGLSFYTKNQSILYHEKRQSFSFNMYKQLAN